MMSDPHDSTLAAARRLIEDRIGLAASAQLRADFAPILQRAAQGNLPDLLEQLRRSNDDAPIWQALIHSLTIGETYFWRDKTHFRLLRDRILPPLLHERRAQGRLALSIWSAGCASGEEAYSIAIALSQAIPDWREWRLTILGTDINARAIETARRGIYRPWSFRHSDEAFQAQYFTPAEGGLQIKAPYRASVAFQRANLLGAPPLPQFDLIFCRHVLLYFSRERAIDAENLLYRTLSPGGWLLLGSAEALRHNREQWALHIYPGTALYQKPLRPTERAAVRYEAGGASSDAPPPAPQAADLADLYPRALAALRADEADEARRYLAELLAQEPNHARAHALLAASFANRQAIPEARAQLGAALRADPLLADAHYLLALIQQEAGDDEGARQSLQAALYCQRDHALAALMLGHWWWQHADTGKAERYWNIARRAASLPPTHYLSDVSDLRAADVLRLLENTGD